MIQAVIGKDLVQEAAWMGTQEHPGNTTGEWDGSKKRSGSEEPDRPSDTGHSDGTAAAAREDFIRAIVIGDLKNGKNDGRIQTRFPPEPNGYLHIGHAKAITLDFGVAAEYGGKCNLRFDDTNPTKEDVEYVDSIMEDIRWLGFEWDGLHYASDYFERLYQYAEELVRLGLAYVDDLTAEEIREYRGTLTQSGKESPYRNRSVEENMDLFRRMRAGEFPDGSRVLRSKIDMASPNMNMRDPAIYRIRRAHHHRTGDAWCIYPMYDFTHCLSDMIEGITHSLCSLEFEDHRPLYDWYLDVLKTPCHPQQIEFARLNVTHTVMSKRKLRALVEEGLVSGWDDPRMPTLCGMRRRGFTAEAIRSFMERVGVSKRGSVVDFGLLEHAVREDLNRRSSRVMAVLNPLRLVIENYPDARTEEFESQVNPEDSSEGMRKVPFSRELYIEQDDFREVPPPKFHRLHPGNEVRLRSAYVIKCVGVVKDDKGNVVEVRCTYDPETKGGSTPDGRKIKGTIHWVSAAHALNVEVRLYDHLFSAEFPGESGVDFREELNPHSLDVIRGFIEPSVAAVRPGTRYQFERLGYFNVDLDSKPQAMIFNRTVSLRDTWAKIEAAQGGSAKKHEPAPKKLPSPSTDSDEPDVDFAG
jgi:glutaminyl-tRNA synthetase